MSVARFCPSLIEYSNAHTINGALQTQAGGAVKKKEKGKKGKVGKKWKEKERKEGAD
jgi:hypothetical protein